MPNQNTEKSRRVEIESVTGSSFAALSEGLTQVFNQIDDLVSVWDSELRLIFCNDAFKSINLGLEEVIRPGTPLETHVRARIEARRYPGLEGDLGVDALIRGHKLLDPAETGPYDVHLHDDVIIEIKKQRGDSGLTTILGRNVTEQRKAERQRRQSEARLRHLAESSSEWFWESDPDGRLTWVSNSFSTRTTIDTSTIIGKARWEFDGPAKNDDDFWRDHKAAIARGDAIVNFEFPYFNSDGQTGFSRINGSPILNDDGARLGFRGTATDITETRKRQQHTLNLPAAMDAMAEAVAVYDAEDKIIFANQAYRKLNTNIDGKLNEGEVFEEIHRTSLDRGLVGEGKGREEVWSTDRASRHRHSNEPFEIERPGGVWFLVNQTNLNNGGSVIVFTDNSELKKTQNDLIVSREDLLTNQRQLEDIVNQRTLALGQSEKRFKDFAEASSEFFWETDADHRFTFFSAGFEAVTGYDPRDLIGSSRRELVETKAGDAKARSEHLAAIDARKPFRDFRNTYTRRTGEQYWSDVSGRPYFNQTGEFLGYRGTSRTVTDLVTSMAELNEAKTLFDQLIESTSQGYLRTDRQATVIDVNSSMCRILGRPRSQVIGRSSIELVDEENAKIFRA